MDPDVVIDDGIAPAGEPPAVEPQPDPPPGDEWKVSKQGRQYFNPTPGVRGARVIYRRGPETIADAIARDQREQAEAQRDKRPRRKSKAPKMPEAPRGVDLKELETTLAEALKAPAMVCATFGDEWAAEHFTKSGPYLARNLILASQHNPWLRRKLEEAATGEDAMMMVVSLVGVGGALFTYIVPPVVYWFNLPAPAKTREMFGIPPRKGEQPAAYAADRPPETAEPPAVAA